MTSFDHFEMDQLPGKESSKFAMKTRDTSISDSIQSSNNNSLTGSLESLTSPIGLPIGISVLPVKDSLAGLSIAVSQEGFHSNIPAYTTAKQYDYAKFANPPNAVSSVIELPNKVLISSNDSGQLASAPIINNSHQVIQIIQAPKDVSSFTSSHSQPSENSIVRMSNNNNSSNNGHQAVKYLDTYGKHQSLVFPTANNPAPGPDIAHPQLIPIFPSNNMSVAPPHSKQVLQPQSEHAHILLTSQSGSAPDGYQILQAIPTSGQHSQELAPVQQLVIASSPDASYAHANQCNGNFQYSIITAPSAVSHPTQTLKPLSPPKQVRTHKHLQYNTRPQQAQIKVEPFYPPQGHVIGTPDQVSQPPYPHQETDHRRSESSSSGAGMPRKRKTGIPRKIVQMNNKIKKERTGEEMDTGADGDDNPEEFCGSPYGTDEMEYSPDSDPSASLPTTTLVEPHIFPSIMLTEGSKVTFTTWNEYCQLTGSLPAPYALLNQNNSLVPESNLFQAGVNLEILDWATDKHFAVRLVTVSRIHGSRLRLELIASEGRQPIWTTIDSYRLHYLGWGSERGLTYLPPDDLNPDINWPEYIRELIATQDNSNIDMLRPSFDQEMNAYFTLFRPGMLLEAAMDPLNREVISVCVVKRCSGQTVLLYEQNEDELSEFSRFYQEFSVDSPYIRALGWANKHHKQLRPSKESSNSKDWPQLLAKIIIHKNRLPVPLEAFNRTSCFYPGMKLEAVDWRDQEIIRVATVIAVNDKQQIKVHYDGLPNEMDYWFDADGKDIFPPGYCDTTGHLLEKPEELDISQAAPAFLCQMESASLPPTQVVSSPDDILSQIPTASIGSPAQDETTPLPSNQFAQQEELQPKVTVTLHVSHDSFPGSFLNPDLVKQIPTEIGPVTPVHAQTTLLTYFLEASTNRQLLWDQIDDCPGPNAVMLRLEQNSPVCKYIPNIESYLELFNFLNKLRQRLDFGPDFIRICTPPPTHEVHQPEKIPSSIPPLTLPQSKSIISSNPPQSVVIPNSAQVPTVSSRLNIVQPPPSPKLDPITPMIMRPPPQYIPNLSSSRLVPVSQSKQRIPQCQPPITNTRPLVHVMPNPHVNVPLSVHPVSTTNIIPLPSNYMNGTSHPQPHVFKMPQPDPASWSVDQVCEFIRTLDHANVEEIVEKFKEQKIDGACLLELKVDLLVNFMKLELGPAMKIIKNIQQLLPPSFQRTEDVSTSK